MKYNTFVHKGIRAGTPPWPIRWTKTILELREVTRRAGRSGKVYLSHPLLCVRRDGGMGGERGGYQNDSRETTEQRDDEERQRGGRTVRRQRMRKWKEELGERANIMRPHTHVHTHTSSWDQPVFPSSKHHIQIGDPATDILTTWWESIFNTVCVFALVHAT